MQYVCRPGSLYEIINNVQRELTAEKVQWVVTTTIAAEQFELKLVVDQCMTWLVQPFDSSSLSTTQSYASLTRQQC